MTSDIERSVKARRAGYKDLITTQRQRDIRIEILELQAMELGWKRPAVRVERVIPTFPFIFTWEHEQLYEVRPCRWADQRLAVWQPHRPGIGRPAFTDMANDRSAFHSVRSRKAVVEDLCAMCGGAIDITDILWVSIFADPLISDDDWASVPFPLFHLECIRHALNGCPFLRAGFGGFAPYRGKLRKQGMILSPKGLSESFGLKVHPDAKIVADVLYQVPAREMARLQELAAMGCPDGFHYRDEDPARG